MLSIIICSRTQLINTSLSENISKTVGCDYELIVIDNSENQYSIFEAYNLGIDKSTSDYLSFIHDDILFHTKGWGNVIQRIFREEQQIGLIGVAGAKSKTKIPSLWWSCPKKDKVVSIIQHIPEREIQRWDSGFGNILNTEVIVVDGVFMAIRKDSRIRFNSEIKGFHNYDLNISLEYKKMGYKIMATKEILIEHFSLGAINEEWLESSYQLYTLYKDNLPLDIKNSRTNKKQEITNALWFINECLKFQNYKIAFAIWLKLFYLDPFLLFHIIYWKNNYKNNTNLFIQYFD